MALLQVENLEIAVPGGRHVVDRVGFAVGAGEIVAVVGESGSGKTMIGRAVLGLLPQGIRVAGGRIAVDGEDVLRATPRRLRQLRGATLGMVFQEPLVSLNPAMPIGRQMAEGLRLHFGLKAPEIRQRCLAMLARIGIEDPERCLKAYPHEFSGGMRQRIMLASVMLLAPKLLIADEPTTALDTLTQRDVLDLMVELTREAGTAVLLITHNLGLVARYASRVVVLRRGAKVEEGATDAVLSQPADAYTRALVEALPTPRAAASRSGTDSPILSARGLKVAYVRDGGLFRAAETKLAVRGVDIDIHPGETVAVVGGSGSGKTTLGRALLRLIPNHGGEIRYRGADVTAAGRDALHGFRRDCQIVFQDPFSSLDPRMRVGALVDEALRLVPGLDAAARAARVAETLDAVGLAGFERRLPHELSGGQRQRIAIARAIVGRPALVVADEPISALDMTIQAQILDLFARLQAERGFACLFISHDLAAVRQIADRVVVMARGEIVEQGPCAAVFARPRHDYTRRLLDASPVAVAGLAEAV